MKLTFISDSHNKHKHLTSHLPGGDVLIHAGDISSMGYEHEIKEFCKWFNGIEGYKTKIFIAGNHDWGFQLKPEKMKEVVDFYSDVTYIQDETIVYIDDSSEEFNLVNIYGSPWQPEFYNWAFNLPKNGPELKSKWDMIPEDTDILITHGPAYGYLDKVIGQYDHLGCELLTNRIKTIKPKIHVSGHIHSGYGYVFDGDTHYINASVLNEQYNYTQKPLSVEWDPKTNEMVFLD
jgi:Icc-related predicted phosphoesterase